MHSGFCNEYGRKKRTNRFVQSQQSKLEVRRLQVLSQERSWKCLSKTAICQKKIKSQVTLDGCKKSHESLETKIKEFGSCSSSGSESNLKSPISTLFGNKSSRCYTESSRDNEDCVDDRRAVSDASPVIEKQYHPYVDPAESQIMFNFQEKSGAWHPNDAFRPRCLPNPGLHHVPITSSAKSMNLGCPICFEDLDSTDSSFLPCPCGFHLCLFCHKRILEADGRCPGCRKDYNL